MLKNKYVQLWLDRRRLAGKVKAPKAQDPPPPAGGGDLTPEGQNSPAPTPVAGDSEGAKTPPAAESTKSDPSPDKASRPERSGRGSRG